MPQTTLGPVSDSRVTSQTVRYRERLWVPWWWWPLGFGLAAILAKEVNMGIRTLPEWLPYAVLGAVAWVVYLVGRHMSAQQQARASEAREEEAEHMRSRREARLPGGSPALVLWAQAYGVRAGDRLSLRIEGPDGAILAEKAVEIDKSQAYRMTFIGRRSPTDGWPAGTYRGLVRLVRAATPSPLQTQRETTVELR